MTPQQLVQRRETLLEQQRDIEVELTAIEGALAMHGARRPGRPRRNQVYTHEEAIEAHNLRRKGSTLPWVIEADRQYHRTVQRARRARIKNAQQEESG